MARGNEGGVPRDPGHPQLSGWADFPEPDACAMHCDRVSSPPATSCNCGRKLHVGGDKLPGGIKHHFFPNQSQACLAETTWGNATTLGMGGGVIFIPLSSVLCGGVFFAVSWGSGLKHLETLGGLCFSGTAVKSCHIIGKTWSKSPAAQCGYSINHNVVFRQIEILGGP